MFDVDCVITGRIQLRVDTENEEDAFKVLDDFINGQVDVNHRVAVVGNTAKYHFTNFEEVEDCPFGKIILLEDYTTAKGDLLPKDSVLRVSGYVIAGCLVGNSKLGHCHYIPTKTLKDNPQIFLVTGITL